jgi:acyl transferase domain-containing protein/acyl carrier protein
MKKTIFIYSGEGTKSSESDFRLLTKSKHWAEIKRILMIKYGLELEQVWTDKIDSHKCPHSPVLTVITQICLSDLWQQWGYHPDVVIGHSIGELSAAYQAGFYSLEEILTITHQIGKITSKLEGVMVHGALSDEQIEALPINLSSLNFIDDTLKHVTLSGYGNEMEHFLEKHPNFVKMKIPHPWHHPDYGQFSAELNPVQSKQSSDIKFVSGISAGFKTRLNEDHWRQWLVNPVDFIGAMQAVKTQLDEHAEIIEIGFHPVLDKCCEIFKDATYVSSMFRGEKEINWIMHQRKRLDQKVFLDKLTKSIETFRPNIDFDTPLAYQGFTSIVFFEFSKILEPYFPSLAPQDFYRYKSINQLIEQFGIQKEVFSPKLTNIKKNGVVISGLSCRFPTSVETPTQFWQMLVSKNDQVKSNSNRGEFEAGYLDDKVNRFDHKFFNISDAEAGTMDPQQILALELTELLWRDAGIDPSLLDKRRIGVYIGAWNQEYRGNSDSVYYPTGTNPSIIASRISYHYDLRGPSWVSNTACSSSLVAVHYAAKDIEAGRVDYAIAGGVNMLLGDDFSQNMMNSGFLSKDHRCKAFDNSANGYVRAEGGGLVLLVNKALAENYYAELSGSSINQNGGRSQVITAPHPEAQEELIIDACHDAAISPSQIDYLECHGTGTKIGDPIEISALQNTISKGRKEVCHIGSVKSNIGHLESAAGIAGLIKSVLILNHGVIPPNLHFNYPNQYIDFQSSRLMVVTKETKIDNSANIGISSFGFGGANAHVIIKGAEDHVRKKIEDIATPFDRSRAPSLSEYFETDHFALAANGKIQDKQKSADAARIGKDDIEKMVKDLFCKLTSIEEINPDIELTDQGLDSMSGTELIAQLESRLDIELDPDILFEYPFSVQLVDELFNKIQA